MEKSFVGSNNRCATGWQTWLGVGLAAILSTAGCSRQTPFELSAVRGTVVVNGRTLRGGKVMFAPIARGDSMNAGKPAFGKIDADGRYSLSTYGEDDGAVVGEHWVTLFIPVGTQAPNEAGEVEPTFQRVRVPQKQVVAAGADNEIPLEIKSPLAKR